MVIDILIATAAIIVTCSLLVGVTFAMEWLSQQHPMLALGVWAALAFLSVWRLVRYTTRGDD